MATVARSCRFFILLATTNIMLTLGAFVGRRQVVLSPGKAPISNSYAEVSTAGTALLQRSVQRKAESALQHDNSSKQAAPASYASGGPGKAIQVWDLYRKTPNLLTESSDMLHRKSRASDRQCGVLWFYHIPKTGGTAVGDWLQRLKSAGYIDVVLPLMSMDHLVNYSSFFEDNIEPVLASPQGRLVAVHHHHRGPGLYGFEAQFEQMESRLESVGCKLRRVTFLRQPVQRLTSALFYNMGGPSGDEVLLPQWMEVLQNSSVTEYHNCEIRYILNNKMGEYKLEPFELRNATDDETWMDAYEEADAILSDFDLVGTTEDLEGGILKIADLLGMPEAVAEVPLQTVNANPHADVESGPLQRMLEDTCKYDTLLYNQWT